MAYVDFKVTIWERVHIDDDKVDEVIEKIKDGTVTSSEDMFTEFEDRVAIETEFLLETCEQISPEENDNQATIEVGIKGGEAIYTNEIK